MTSGTTPALDATHERLVACALGGVTEGASHAWAEAWVPGTGWVGFDATHPVRAGENHVRVAVGRDYRDAAPTRGVYVGMATGAMNVNVRTREAEAEG